MLTSGLDFGKKKLTLKINDIMRKLSQDFHNGDNLALDVLCDYLKEEHDFSDKSIKTLREVMNGMRKITNLDKIVEEIKDEE